MTLYLKRRSLTADMSDGAGPGLPRDFNPEHWDALRQGKLEALEVLSSVGFVDVNDAQHPSWISYWFERYDPHTQEVQAVTVFVETEHVSVQDVIKFVYLLGKEHGDEEARSAMREALGIAQR